jgi:hypothetical protein
MIFSPQSGMKIRCESIVMQKSSSVMAFSVSYRAAVGPYKQASNHARQHSLR